MRVVSVICRKGSRLISKGLLSVPRMATRLDKEWAEVQDKIRLTVYTIRLLPVTNFHIFKRCPFYGAPLPIMDYDYRVLYTINKFESAAG